MRGEWKETVGLTIIIPVIEPLLVPAENNLDPESMPVVDHVFFSVHATSERNRKIRKCGKFFKK